MAKDADTGEAIIHPMPSVIDQTMAKIAEISAGSGGVSGVTTGYPGLDDKLMSLRAGGLGTSWRLALALVKQVLLCPWCKCVYRCQ